ncbi:E3 ubiquitin-protein ligase parkin-like [Mercenaria mercenaria]|uniref:E3 ubiquitin-protein ligase parkin-like n=1 Tax=Mercenaria mercenaria TaxID=6596 RepID=UPI00234F73C4|nr:E3 ubiquitin-protein ligase parkin-like [Mercenaria mercenaria]
MLLYNYLSVFPQNIRHFSHTEMSTSLNIQLAKDKHLMIDITCAMQILDVKTEISRKTGLNTDEFDLIFCGKLLSAEASLKDLNLGQGSVLHLYRVGVVGQAKPLLSVRQKDDTDKKRYQYYVYCKKCDGLFPGKLRVRCSDCMQGAILLDKEPCNWDDVLLPGRLSGHCTTCNKTSTAQFYFKCCEHDGEEECVPLKYIRPNRRCVECVTCTVDRDMLFVISSLRYRAGQTCICVECFKSYARVSLDQRSFIEDANIGYSLPCPVGCEDSLMDDVHHFKLLGNKQYERYKDFGAEECLLQSGGILCPNTGCGEGIIVEDDARNVQCRTCHLEFCRHCTREIHSGTCQPDDASARATTTLNVDSERALRARWESASMETIQETTKSCPHCSVKTERSGGCMHMKCSRCSKDWCWLCEKEWTRTCQGDHWFGEIGFAERS